jgi:hypothetical protein
MRRRRLGSAPSTRRAAGLGCTCRHHATVRSDLCLRPCWPPRLQPRPRVWAASPLGRQRHPPPPPRGAATPKHFADGQGACWRQQAHERGPLGHGRGSNRAPRAAGRAAERASSPHRSAAWRAGKPASQRRRLPCARPPRGPTPTLQPRSPKRSGPTAQETAARGRLESPPLAERSKNPQPGVSLGPLGPPHGGGSSSQRTVGITEGLAPWDASAQRAPAPARPVPRPIGAPARISQLCGAGGGARTAAVGGSRETSRRDVAEIAAERGNPPPRPFPTLVFKFL